MKEYIFGKRCFEECINSEYQIIKVLISDNIKDFEHFRDLCVKNNISFCAVKKYEIDNLTGTSKNNGIAFKIKELIYYDIDGILDHSRENAQIPFFVVLDCLEDPRNFGAIIRSAEAAGVHGIIFPENRAVDVTPFVIRSSAGSFFHQRLCRVKNIARTIDYLKKENIWIYGLSEKAEKLYYEEDFKIPIAFVIGSEEEGIRRLVKEKCDFLIKIPMLGKVSALNASVSASIVFFEAIKQRYLKDRI